VAGGLEMVVKDHMALEASGGLLLSSCMLFPQIGLKQTIIGCPTGCPNAPTRPPVFLQDPTERNRNDLEGGKGPREGE